jgi:hypothetical protein
MTVLPGVINEACIFPVNRNYFFIMAEIESFAPFYSFTSRCFVITFWVCLHFDAAYFFSPFISWGGNTAYFACL